MKNLLCLFTLVLFTSASGHAAERPNILILFADDLGYSDVGCYGGEIATPNLDALAANGLRFTQFYNTARCWPSRAVLLTGYYAQQVRRDTLPGVKSGGGGVRPNWARLLPDMLKPAGYRSYHSGKWHIDGPRLAAGFDRSYSLEDHNHNFAPQNHFLDDQKLPAIDKSQPHYTTTLITDYALDFLREHAANHKDQPFFSYVAYTVPHFPLQAPPGDIAKYRDKYLSGWDKMRQARWSRQKSAGLLSCELSALERDVGPPYDFPKDLEKLGPGEINRPLPWTELTTEQRHFQADKMAVHAAMVDRMDQEIGRILDQLRAMNAFENTIILFASDNGASAEIMVRGDGHDPHADPGSAASYLCLGPGFSSASNTPFRRHKTWVHEGGISTPLIVHWPQGVSAKGELRHNPAHLIDVVPTLVELSGGKRPTEWDGKPVPSPPGKSLVPVFKQDGTVPHDALWWLHEGNRALRIGDWKLVAAGQDGAWELYDLKSDRAESHNLASSQPDRVRDMQQVWTRMRDEFLALAKQE